MRFITKRYILALLPLLCSTVVLGQSSESSILRNQELASARSLLQAGRADIIREELRLSDEESAEFWPVYDKYHAEIMAVRDRQAKMIAEFVRRNREGDLSNEYADNLVEENFDIKGDLLKVQEKFLRQFRRVLPALKVARFYQLENKMDAETDAQLALFIPLVEGM